MGGGGSYYDRDVTARSKRTVRGFSDTAEERFSKSKVNPAVLPKNRKLYSTCKSPLVYAFDVTGSMGDLPLIIWDKMAMIAGQLIMQEYLEDPMMSLAAVGDVVSDNAPIQICDFSPIRSLDDWLERLWLERKGGGQAKESYEFTAYFYSRLYDMEGATTPTLLFTGDEGFREKLTSAELKEHFGGEHESVDTATIFEELKEKFNGNVFLIHPTFTLSYGVDADLRITAQWQELLGKERVVLLESSLAIADVTLGVIALASGARTLDQYIEDIRNRPLEMEGVKYEPQSEERIAEVRRSLELLATIKEPRVAGRRRPKKASKNKQESKTGDNEKNWKL